MKDQKKVTINRDVLPGDYPLVEVFPDIADFDILSVIFPDKAERETAPADVNVHVTEKRIEMRVTDEDGTIIIGLNHLKNASQTILHLDIFHELVHVKQHREGRKLYDTSKSYVDRETEIEAFKISLLEAERLHLSVKEISDYLMLEWITNDEYKRLLRRLDIPSA